MTAIGICDFCSSPTGPGKRTYRAKAQIILSAPGSSWVDQGEWVGCAGCAELIDGEKWKALMDRAKTLNPGLRAALGVGKLNQLVNFIAEAWSGIFAQPPEVFL